MRDAATNRLGLDIRMCLRVAVINRTCSLWPRSEHGQAFRGDAAPRIGIQKIAGRALVPRDRVRHAINGIVLTGPHVSVSSIGFHPRLHPVHRLGKIRHGRVELTDLLVQLQRRRPIAGFRWRMRAKRLLDGCASFVAGAREQSRDLLSSGLSFCNSIRTAIASAIDVQSAFFH